MDRNKYLEEAIRIGDEILRRVEKTDEGYVWKTMTSTGDFEIQWVVSESLYSGTAGIVYFFLELHRRTNDDKYLEAVTEGARWLENYCATNSTEYYAFYTGRMGVSYLMLVLADYLKDESYKAKALKIAEGCEAFLHTSRKVDDLINGYSGALLCLLHLHAATGDEGVLKNIESYTRRLIERANITPHGFYWDRVGTNIKGLCGFSHGASGIGYVFLELGKYFDNESFYWIAKRAFAYENHFFHEEFKNWPDFRRGFYDEKTLNENRDKYLNGEKDYFLLPGDMSAWCHGAPGIGLSRIRAYEVLKDDIYKRDIDRAVEKTGIATLDGEMSVASCILCHGIGGNAILFLEAARVLGDTTYIDMARQAGDRALDYVAEKGKYLSGYSFAGTDNDISLFMGDSGIGYFYLMLSDEKQEKASILKPDLNQVFSGKVDGELASGYEGVFVRLANGLYPLTFEKVKKDIDLNILKGGGSFMLKLRQAIQNAISAKDDDAIQQVWEYELKKEELDSAIESHSYNRIRRIVEIEKNQVCLKTEAELIHTQLVLPEEHVLLELPEEVAKDNEGEEYAIFIPTPEFLLEFPLNDFAYTVIKKFEQPNRVEQVIVEMVDEFEVTEQSEIDQVKEVTIYQITEALHQGILFIDHSPVVHQ
ncbi:hypothetical protein JMN32_24750 [Fulvivirga sp. 29W222]|uniref:Lanthionine synthetase C-like protein n=1 Tax=Fulvivirga marina TaxID=2494733 RepID=A0A937G0H0_9BACT|nr:lanthionine synthetase LanC family protein [Fulvivirga marina]MBL6449545.1 hypothetical protein [Fulvivirga marina]